VYCSNCAHELSPQAANCPACGASIARPAATQAATAPDTGAPADALTAQAKTLLLDAWESLKLLAAHPAGNFARALERLGPRRALRVGFVFAAFFDLCLVFARIETWNLIFRMLGAGPDLPDYFKSVFLGAIPFGLLWGACWLAIRLFHGAGNPEAKVFIAGATLIPISLPILVLGLLGTQSPGIFSGCALLAFGYAILMLYSGWTHVLKIPEATASRTIPVVLLLLAGALLLIFPNLF
jgi:hypothetical protein